MKIKATSYEKERDETVAQYAERCLDGGDYGSGQLETIARGNDNNSRAIGRVRHSPTARRSSDAGRVPGATTGTPSSNHEPRQTRPWRLWRASTVPRPEQHAPIL